MMLCVCAGPQRWWTHLAHLQLLSIRHHHLFFHHLHFFSKMLLQLNQSDLLNITSVFEDNGNYTNNNVTISSVFKPNPMNRNLWAIIFKLIGATIAIPLNLLLSIIILHLRRFRSKPRNLFLLGILFSNLTATIPPLVEVVDYFFISPPGSIPEEGRIGSSLVSCKIYIVIRGLPEVFLLLNILFSLVDKYYILLTFLKHLYIV